MTCQQPAFVKINGLLVICGLIRGAAGAVCPWAMEGTETGGQEPSRWKIESKFWIQLETSKFWIIGFFQLELMFSKLILIFFQSLISGKISGKIKIGSYWIPAFLLRAKN